MMSKPLVSVVCTNYNKGDWIKDAIDSFLRQEVNFEYEIVIIDDKSTDHSPEIIKEYLEKHPDKIRVFYNSENLGITRTWIKACKQAKGKYVARCDGDDFWVDNKKLQKQVDLLEKSKVSKWCYTDYDAISSAGKVIHEAVFETRVIDRPKSYAELLVTKGFTAPSSWLIEKKLLQDINDCIDLSAVDDTFNIQLELFNKTKPTYIPDTTTVYRISEGSDSKPKEESDVKKRDERLLDTQLEYINKYTGVEYKEIITMLLRRDVDREDRLRLINRQRKYIEEQDHLLRERQEIIQQKDRQINELLNSKKYKIGKALTAPISITKAALKERKK